MQLYLHQDFNLEDLHCRDTEAICEGEYHLAINEFQELVGVIGIAKEKYLQILVLPKFRRKGNADRILDIFLRNKLYKDVLYGVVHKDNKASLRLLKSFPRIRGSKMTPKDCIRLKII